MSEQGAARVGEFVFVPANSIDDGSLIAFAALIWPEHPDPKKILSSWWRRAEPKCAVAAVHEASGAMAGVCAGLPCAWIIAGQLHSAIAISVWYVSPHYAGKGLGKRLVQQFEAPDVFMYTFSISDAAVANFTKLGWVGPHGSFLMVLPLPRLAAIPLHFLGRGDLDFQEYAVDSAKLPASLAADLDRIETGRRHGGAHMRRGADDWSWHLSVAGARGYRFCVARRGGEPVGFVAVRRVTPGSSNQLGRVKAAMIADLATVNDDPVVLRALAGKAVTGASELRAAIVLTATTVLAHRQALSRLGFVSPATPVLGRFLQRRAPRFMWVPRGVAAGFTADSLALTFVDSDLDFSL
jgi:GNAT superfamily N-acetyltransferase